MKSLKTKNPEELKMNSNKLSNLDSIIKTEYDNIAGIVILKNGYIAYENYYNEYSPEDYVHVASVTKSILSALVGIAIDKGFIKSVDEKVIGFFPEYKINDKIKQQITIKHLLTMTAPYSFDVEPFQELCASPDWVKFAIDLLGGKGEIGEFKYSTAGAHILSAIITKSTGKSAIEFSNEYLFKPIGISELTVYEMTESKYMEFLTGKNVAGWVTDPNGNSTGGWGLTLTPRNMASFGLLYLKNGLWNNEQIIPEKWIQESISMNPNHYGYMWWLFDENNIFTHCALGDGGNVICCIPEKNAVIAIASKFMMNPSNRLKLINEYIIPAL